MNSLIVEGVPDDFCLFAFGSSRHWAFWKYRLRAVSDWARGADITIFARTRCLQLQEVDNHLYLLSEEPFADSDARSAAEFTHTVLARRAGLLTSAGESFVSPIESDGPGRLRFDARFDDHFVFGTAERRHLFVSGRGEPAFTHVRIATRAGSGVSAHDHRFDDISVRPVVVTARIDRGARREPSALMVRMHEEGMPAQELDFPTMGSLERDLEGTLPELHVLGHLMTRTNIVMRCAMETKSRMDLQKALAWCHEASCMALEMPDDPFRHFLAAALQAKIAMLISADQSLWNDSAVSALDSYVRLLRRLPEPSPIEVSVACFWFLATFHGDFDLASIAAMSDAIVALSDADSMVEHVNSAFRTSHAVAPKALDGNRRHEASLALKAIRRCELAVNLMHRIASTRKGAGLAIHQALFSDINLFNCGYQAVLYGLPIEEVNSLLEATMSGLPPGVMLLRPLSVVRTIYLRNQLDGHWIDSAFGPGHQLPFLSLESALANAVRPLLKATNAVGGLTDIFGMGRSGAAGVESDTLWKQLVTSVLETCDIIFVLPDMSSGLRWELEQLRRTDRMPDCIFVLLPEDHEWSDGGNRRAFGVARCVPQPDSRGWGLLFRRPSRRGRSRTAMVGALGWLANRSSSKARSLVLEEIRSARGFRNLIVRPSNRCSKIRCEAL